MLESEDRNRRIFFVARHLEMEKCLKEHLCYASAALPPMIMLKCCHLISLRLRTGYVVDDFLQGFGCLPGFVFSSFDL